MRYSGELRLNAPVPFLKSGQSTMFADLQQYGEFRGPYEALRKLREIRPVQELSTPLQLSFLQVLLFKWCGQNALSLVAIWAGM
jgi:hypothetical protein